MNELTSQVTRIDELWTQTETAKRLGLSPHTLENWRVKYTPDDPRCLPYVRFGRRVYYIPSQVTAWIQSRIQPRYATLAEDK